MNENIAVYWDFENVHASLCSVRRGGDWYRNNRFSKQPAEIDISSIMEYVAGLGSINLNKAYANWGFLFPYNFDLHEYSIDLIQMFPRGRHGKNGADIRMAIDVIEDLNLNPHISKVVILGGDSDYISIAQRVRQKGKSIVGIGIKETTNQYWIKACNEFKFYSSLLVKANKAVDLDSEEHDDADLDDAKELITKAINRITDNSEESYVLKARLKPMMIALDSSFDEGNFGFTSFGDFLKACSDTVTLEPGDHDHLVILKGGTLDPRPASPRADDRHPYEKLLKRQQIRLPKPGTLLELLKTTFRILEEEKEIDSYQTLKNRIISAAETSETEASKVKALLYKSLCFSINRERSTITLVPEIVDERALVERVGRTLVKRILDNIDPDHVDSEALSQLLWDDSDSPVSLSQLVDHYRASHGDTDDEP